MNWAYLRVFAQSNFLEWLVYTDIARDQGWVKTLGRLSLINLVTHPIVFFIIMRLPISYVACILWAEAFAVVVETVLVRRIFGLNWGSAAARSLVANLISWQLGPVLTYWSLFIPE